MTNITRILRRSEVESRTGIPESTMYALIAQNMFPKPIRILKRAVGWLEEDINNWIEKKITESRTDA